MTGVHAPTTPAGDVTRLLRAWRAGDPRALGVLTPLIYRELRGRAARSMRKERQGHTLERTDLVNEAFLRLVHADVSWQDRAHFLAVAARAMRHILIDHARARLQAKRGGGQAVDVLDEAAVAAPTSETDPADLLALDRALTVLRSRDQASAEALTMSFFGGMTVREIAEVLQVSKSSVQRKISFAKAWLHRRIGSPASDRR